MKRVEREIYGFGPKLSTQSERLSKVVMAILLCVIFGMALGVVWA